MREQEHPYNTTERSIALRLLAGKECESGGPDQIEGKSVEFTHVPGGSQGSRGV